MAISTLVDRVKISVLSSGVGPFELGAAVPAFRGVEALIDGSTYSYATESGSNFEVGTGVYLSASGMLVRTPTSSSNGGAAVSFPAGVEVAFTVLAQDILPPGALPIVQSTGADMAVAMSQKATTDALTAVADSVTAVSGAKAQAAALGVAAAADNMGTFTGVTIPDNVTAKAGMQSLETTLEALGAIAAAIDAAKATAASQGIAANALDFGTFTGVTIPDGSTAKAALQALETGVETKSNASAIGIAATAANMGTFTGVTIPDNVTAKAGMQAVETSLELKLFTADALDVAGAGGALGAATVGFKVNPTAPYISKTVGDRLNKVVYVTDDPFNATPTGPNVTTALQNAVNSGASEVRLPALRSGQNYIVNATISIPAQIKIIGQNPWATGVQCTTANVPIFSIDSKSHVGIHSLRLEYSPFAPISGGDAILINNSYFCDFRDLWCNNTWNGIRMTGTNSGNHSIIGFRSFAYKQSGLRLENVIDVNLTNFRMSANDSINGADAGIALVGGVEAFSASQGDITLGLGHAISTAGISGSGSRGQSPWYNKFSQVYCDSTKGAPIYLRDSSYMDFIDCWAASGGHDEAVGFGSALDVSGVDMSHNVMTRFIGGQFYGNGGRGALVYGDNYYTTFQNVAVTRNQYTRPGNGAGIEFLNGAFQFKVVDCDFFRDADTTNFKQFYGPFVNSGGNDYYQIRSNQLGGCTLFDGGTGTNKTVDGNW